MKRIALILLLISSTVYAQHGKIKGRHFPKKWDINNELKEYKVLAWFYKRGRIFEAHKKCLVLSIQVDLFNDTAYTLIEKVCSKVNKNKKQSFSKWVTFSRSMTKGTDTLIAKVSSFKFKHKPSEAEIYNCIDKWGDFKFYEKRHWKTLSAGLDNSLWVKDLGFIPSRKWFQLI